MSIVISGFQIGSQITIPQYGTRPTYYSVGLGAEHGGNGLMSVTYSAPANSTTLVMAASDGGGNNQAGLFNAMTTIASEFNGGAEFWEYVWVNTTDNASAVSNVVADSSIAARGNYIVIAESLQGISASPSLVNTYTAQSSTSTSVNVNVTVHTGEIIVVASGVELGGGEITSMTIPGLTFYRKSSKSQLSSFSNTDYQTLEVWYAINNTGSDINDSVTVTYTSSYDDQALVAATYSGVDLNAPWA